MSLFSRHQLVLEWPALYPILFQMTLGLAIVHSAWMVTRLRMDTHHATVLRNQWLALFVTTYGLALATQNHLAAGAVCLGLETWRSKRTRTEFEWGLNFTAVLLALLLVQESYLLAFLGSLFLLALFSFLDHPITRTETSIPFRINLPLVDASDPLGIEEHIQLFFQDPVEHRSEVKSRSLCFYGKGTITEIKAFEEHFSLNAKVTPFFQGTNTEGRFPETARQTP